MAYQGFDCWFPCYEKERQNLLPKFLFKELFLVLFLGFRGCLVPPSVLFPRDYLLLRECCRMHTFRFSVLFAWYIINVSPYREFRWSHKHVEFTLVEFVLFTHTGSLVWETYTSLNLQHTFTRSLQNNFKPPQWPFKPLNFFL